MKICYVMVGVPGSGKSTFTAKIHALYPGSDIRIFSQDTAYIDFCNKNHGQQWSTGMSDGDVYRYAFDFMRNNQKEFDAYLASVWRDCLLADTLINDRTNLTRKSRARYLQEARQARFTLVGVEFFIPLRTALDRQRSRTDKSVPEHVVRDMYMNQQSLLLGSEVDSIVYVNGITGEMVGNLTS